MNIFPVGQLNNFDYLYVASSKYEKLLNYDDAKFYVTMLEIDGFTDWVLPNSECIDRIKCIQTFQNLPLGFELNIDYEYVINYSLIRKIYNSQKNTFISIARTVDIGRVRPVRIVK